MTGTYSTGVGPLDREIGGGIPPGTLVALFADPASQAELFLHEFAARQDTLYLSAERGATAVTNTLHDGSRDCADVAVVALDSDAPVVDAVQQVERLPEGAVVVVDPVGPLERADPARFRTFLSTLRSQLAGTDGVAVLHGLKHENAPDQRHRTTYAADLVFDLVTEADENTIENRLLVPKFRGGQALTDPVRVELTDCIAVDTSRDIA